MLLHLMLLLLLLLLPPPPLLPLLPLLLLLFLLLFLLVHTPVPLSIPPTPSDDIRRPLTQESKKAPRTLLLPYFQLAMYCCSTSMHNPGGCELSISTAPKNRYPFRAGCITTVVRNRTPTAVRNRKAGPGWDFLLQNGWVRCTPTSFRTTTPDTIFFL